MKFLEHMIVVPYYLKDVVSPLIKDGNNKYYGHTYLIGNIGENLSKRDRAIFYNLNRIFDSMLKYDKYKPLNDSNYQTYKLFTDSTLDASYPEVGLEFDQVEPILETLKDFTESNEKKSYDDLLKIEFITYPGRNVEDILTCDENIKYNTRTHLTEDKIGMVIYVQSGFGNMICKGSDEYTKTEFIANLPEYLYRHICMNIDIDTANRSFLSLARLKRFTNK